MGVRNIMHTAKLLLHGDTLLKEVLHQGTPRCTEDNEYKKKSEATWECGNVAIERCGSCAI